MADWHSAWRVKATVAKACEKVTALLDGVTKVLKKNLLDGYRHKVLSNIVRNTSLGSDKILYTDCNQNKLKKITRRKGENEGGKRCQWSKILKTGKSLQGEVKQSLKTPDNYRTETEYNKS